MAKFCLACAVFRMALQRRKQKQQVCCLHVPPLYGTLPAVKKNSLRPIQVPKPNRCRRMPVFGQLRRPVRNQGSLGSLQFTQFAPIFDATHCDSASNAFSRVFRKCRQSSLIKQIKVQKMKYLYPVFPLSTSRPSCPSRLNPSCRMVYTPRHADFPVSQSNRSNQVKPRTRSKPPRVLTS